MGTRLVRWQWALLITAAFSVTAVVVLRMAPDMRYRDLIAAAINFVSPFFALSWLFSGLRHIPVRRYRRSWSFFFCSVLAFIAGNVYWTYSVLWRHIIPSPSGNDLFFLVSYIFLWIGLLLHSGQESQQPIQKLITATDLCIAVCAAASIAVQLSFPSLIFVEGTPLIAQLHALAYPLVALMTLVCISLMLSHAVPRALEGPRALLVAGIGLLMAGGTWLAYLILANPESAPYLCQSLWPAGFLLCGVAAIWEGTLYQRLAGRPFEVDPFPTNTGMFVSLALMATAILLSLRNVANPDIPPDPRYQNFVLVSMVVLITLIAVRYLLTSEANRALYLALHDLYAKMTWNAATDALTGIINHGYFVERLEIELQRAQRYHHSLSLIFMDLDHFKQINDTYGHHAGDQVLQQVALSLQQGIRETDLVARYGGEEFVILLPETDPAQARALAERLQQEVALAHVRVPGKAAIPITMSCGVASMPQMANSAEELLTAADQAMYRAKRAGRNRVMVARTTLPTPLAGAGVS